MSVSYSKHMPHAPADLSLAWISALGRRLKLFGKAFIPPAMPPKPRNLHLPQRLWRRHGALLAAWYEDETQ